VFECDISDLQTKEHHVDSAPVMPVMRASKIDASDEARNTSIDENLKLVRKRKKVDFLILF